MEIATFINSTNLRQRKLINMKNTSVVFELMHVDDNQNGDSSPLHMFFSVWGGMTQIQIQGQGCLVDWS